MIPTFLFVFFVCIYLFMDGWMDGWMGEKGIFSLRSLFELLV